MTGGRPRTRASPRSATWRRRPASGGSTCCRGATSPTSRRAAARCTPPTSPGSGPRPASRSPCARSYAQGQPKTVVRDGYQVVPQGGPLPRLPPGRRRRAAPAASGPATPWSSTGTACRSSRRCGSGGPSIVVLHHVHAEMWKMVLGDEAPRLARAGELVEAPDRARSPTAAAGSSRCPSSSKADIVEQLRLRARPHRRRAARRRPPLLARRRARPRTRSSSPSAGSCR